jgi:hypothetical protein
MATRLGVSVGMLLLRAVITAMLGKPMKKIEQ